MPTKLTLNLDPKVVAKAKEIARQQKTSVSALFERFVRSIAVECQAVPLDPLTRKATGMISRSRRSDRQLLEEAILERHRL